MATIEAIGFDFDHTLGIDNKLERVAFLELLDRDAPLADEIERIDALLERQRSGAFTIEEAVTAYTHGRGTASPESYVNRYKERCLELVDTFVVAEFGAEEVCSQLQARDTPHAILTNGWSPLQQRKAQKVGFCGEVLVSSEIGAQKPDPNAFARLLSSLGVPAGRAAYVGDSPELDVVGARAAGLHAIWYDTEKKPYPSGLPKPSRVIHSLAELFELL